MGKVMRNFIVTKQADAEAHVDEADIGVTYNEPPKARYATRILFVLLLATGVILITCGVSLLVICRNEVTKHTCGINLNTDPCSDLAVSAYFGCILILSTIFGFGCVGRKAMAVMLLPLFIGELVFGIYVLAIVRASIGGSVQDDLSSRKALCLSPGDNSTIDATTTLPPDVFSCWRQKVKDLPSCSALWDSLPEPCGSNYADRSTDATQNENTAMLQNCSGEVSGAVSKVVWRKTLVIGPLLIILSLVHLVSAICLWFLRKSTAWNRGLGLIPLPNIPSKFSRSRSRSRSRSKQNAMCGTSDQDQSHQSLILNPDDTPANMQKYVFRKLRRQKNTYATV